jgi:hypothetical protein
MVVENQPPYRHCNTKECHLFGEGKQVPCALYELDLLHGRERLTPEEVSDWQAKLDDPCSYQLPLPKSKNRRDMLPEERQWRPECSA